MICRLLAAATLVSTIAVVVMTMSGWVPASVAVAYIVVAVGAQLALDLLRTRHRIRLNLRGPHRGR